jgi:transcriptional regulator with XRE-family HTH domain
MEKNESLKRFKALASDETSPWEQEALDREANDGWRTKAAAIALQVLRCLRSKGLSQKSLAEIVGVSPQYINKVVKGNENLSLETITKLETALGIPLLTIYIGEQHRVGKRVFPAVTVDYYRDGTGIPERVVAPFAHYFPNSPQVSA